MALHAVLFDLDGVLVDSRNVWFRLLNAAAVRFGAPPIDAAAFRPMWGQGVDADAEQLGCATDELATFYNRHFMRYCDSLVVEPAASGVFARLVNAGLATAVVTNTPAPLAQEILSVARLAPDALVGGTDVPRPKPAPDMVERACGLLAVAPADAVVVGDSAFDREAARRAEVRFVGLRTDGDQRIEELDQLPGLLGL